MSIRRPGYYYNAQIQSYLVQFMAIFGGLQVMTGKRTDQGSQTIPVPIFYGQMDKVIAAAIADNTQNAPLRLPVMSATIDTLNIARDRMHGVGVVQENTYVPMGGLVPDDITTIKQLVGVPYNLTVSLHICASNTQQHLQIIEQFLPMFDPLLQIQRSDGLFDKGRIVNVELVSGPQFNQGLYTPVGQDHRLVTSTTQFLLPIWLTVPSEVKKEYVAEVLVRIGMMSQTDLTEQDIINDLDGQQVPYTVVATDSGINF